MVKNTLLLDSGNTRLKYLFNNNTGVFKSSSDFRSFLLTEKPNFVMYASVSSIETILKETLAELDFAFGKAEVQDGFLGLRLAYKEADTLGVDRWLSMLAAVTLFPKQPLVVVNAGTALTIDCIDFNKQHKGGAIAPGIKLSFSALKSETAFLPEVQPQIIRSLGTDTGSCINYGIIQSLASLIEVTAEKFDPSAILLISGGDSSFVANALAIKCQKVPDLVLKGLELYYEVTYTRRVFK